MSICQLVIGKKESFNVAWPFLMENTIAGIEPTKKQSELPKPFVINPEWCQTVTRSVWPNARSLRRQIAEWCQDKFANPHVPSPTFATNVPNLPIIRVQDLAIAKPRLVPIIMDLRVRLLWSIIRPWTKMVFYRPMDCPSWKLIQL